MLYEVITLLLVNLKLWGIIDNDLSKLNEYCRAVAEASYNFG